MMEKYAVYILSVGVSLCLFAFDWIMRFAAKDDSFVKLEKSGETLKSFLYVVIMAAGPYWGVHYFMHTEKLTLCLAVTAAVGLVLFAVEFFILKRGVRSLCVLPLTLIALAESYYFHYVGLAQTTMKMLLFTCAIAALDLFLLLSYSAAKSKVSVFRSGKTLTLIACLISSLLTGVVAGYLIESCVLSVPSLFR